MQALASIQALHAAPAAAQRRGAAPQQPARLGHVLQQRAAPQPRSAVLARAKGAIKPMEQTFTEFELVGKEFKVRGGS